MKPRKINSSIRLALILGLILSFFLNFAAIADDSIDEESTETVDAEATEDDQALPPTAIKAEPEGTLFQDLFAQLLTVVEDEGYALTDEVTPTHNNLAISWSINSEETGENWFTEALVLADIPDAQKPLDQREMSAIYTVRAPREIEKFRELDTSLAEAFGIPEAQLSETASEDNNWGASIEIPGTGSTLEYYYAVEPHGGMTADFEDVYTLSAQIKPIGYEDESLLDALPKLADYLYETRPAGAVGDTQIFVRALVSEQDLESNGVTFHTFELIPSSYTETMFIRHYVVFDDDVSQEDALAVIAYLEEHTPEEVSGLQEHWKKSYDDQEHVSHADGAWSAGFTALEGSKMMWVLYPLEFLNVYQ